MNIDKIGIIGNIIKRGTNKGEYQRKMSIAKKKNNN